MKRTLFVLFLLTLIVVSGGVILQQRTSLAALTQEVEERAEAVALGYIDIVTQQAQPLLTAQLLPVQHPATTALMAAHDELRKPLPLRVRLQYISRLQLALWELINAAAAPAKTETQDPVVALKQSIGAHGPIYSLIDEYNSTAIRWNRAQERSLWNLRARLAGEEHDKLPFLRYDGRQEFIPIIQL